MSAYDMHEWLRQNPIDARRLAEERKKEAHERQLRIVVELLDEISKEADAYASDVTAIPMTVESRTFHALRESPRLIHLAQVIANDVMAAQRYRK